MKRLIFIMALVLCSSCGAQKNISVGVSSGGPASYQAAVAAIKSQDFIMGADMISSPFGNNPNPNPSETFIFLREGSWGHFQAGPTGFVISGRASNIRTRIRNNGNVEFSMTITSDVNSLNRVNVSINMRRGSNRASASISMDRMTASRRRSFAMNGRIFPTRGMSIHIAPERTQMGNFGNPFAF